jgi:hypothetical protein
LRTMSILGYRRWDISRLFNVELVSTLDTSFIYRVG